MSSNGSVTIAGVNLPRKATWATFIGVIALTASTTAFALRIDTRLKSIEEGQGDRWSRTDMETWSNRLQDKNEGRIVVPPLPPHRVFRVPDEER